MEKTIADFDITLLLFQIFNIIICIAILYIIYKLLKKLKQFINKKKLSYYDKINFKIQFLLFVSCLFFIGLGINNILTEGFRSDVNKSLEQGVVTEDLAAKGAKAYKTSEVGDWLVANL